MHPRDKANKEGGKKVQWEERFSRSLKMQLVGEGGVTGTYHSRMHGQGRRKKEKCMRKGERQNLRVKSNR